MCFCVVVGRTVCARVVVIALASGSAFVFLCLLRCMWLSNVLAYVFVYVFRVCVCVCVCLYFWPNYMYFENMHQYCMLKIIISEYLLISNHFFGNNEAALLNGILDNLR